MKKMYIFILIFILFIISITIIGTLIVMGNTPVSRDKDVFTVQSNREVYFNVYGYDIENPNVIVNPYGNSPLTALVMFASTDYSEVSITVKGKYDNDINYTFNKDKYHMIPIYGLYADYDNTVIIKCEGNEKFINIKTAELPEDFKYSDDMRYANYSFYNVNYPYAVDSYGDVRWYLNDYYFGNVTVLDNSNIIIGSNYYTEEEDSVISFYRMNLLGKIYSEYLICDNYYGINGVYEDNVVIKSDKYLIMDLQTGNILEQLDEIDGSLISNVFELYNNTVNYSTVKYSKFGSLSATDMINENVGLFKYSKYKDNSVSISIDSNRIIVINDSDDIVYVVLDKLFDKRVYEVIDIKYINLEGLKGKYNIYYKVNGKVYKTDYYLEV